MYASALNFLDGKICAIQEPSIIIIIINGILSKRMLVLEKKNTELENPGGETAESN